MYMYLYMSTDIDVNIVCITVLDVSNIIALSQKDILFSLHPSPESQEVVTQENLMNRVRLMQLSLQEKQVNDWI